MRNLAGDPAFDEVQGGLLDGAWTRGCATPTTRCSTGRCPRRRARVVNDPAGLSPDEPTVAGGSDFAHEVD